jgi:hypothetical protein
MLARAALENEAFERAQPVAGRCRLGERVLHLALLHVFPEAVGAKQEAVAGCDRERRGLDRRLEVVRVAERAQELAAIGRRAQLLRFEITRVDEALHDAVIARLRNDGGAAEAVETRVSEVAPHRRAAQQVDCERDDRRAHLRVFHLRALFAHQRIVRAAHGAFDRPRAALAGFAQAPQPFADSELRCDTAAQVSARAVAQHEVAAVVA